MSWKNTTLERDALYAEVWASPAQDVAKRYGISGPALAKICRKLSVPVPPRGHWAKKAAGQPTRQSPLGPLPRDASKTYALTVKRDDYRREKFSSEAKAAIEDERASGASISVPEVLTSPHPLVKASAPLLRKGLLNTRAETLSKHRCLDVVVSRGQVTRALCIIDSVIKALEARGLAVEATEPKPAPNAYVPSWERHQYPPSKTGVRIGEAFLEFALEEELDTVWPDEPKPGPNAPFREQLDWSSRHGSPGYDRVPSGRLALKLQSGRWLDAPRSSWRDGKRRKLEEQLNEFVVALLDLGERHRLWRLEREREELRRAEAQRRAEEAERRRKMEAARVEDLNERIGAWTDAAAIEALASEMERLHGDASPRAWLDWARERASALRQRATAIPAPPD